MVRIELTGDPIEAPSMREEIIEHGYELDAARSVERTDAHPDSEEEYFEERYDHPDGNVVRFFPHCYVASGPDQGRDRAYLIEIKPEEAQ